MTPPGDPAEPDRDSQATSRSRSSAPLLVAAGLVLVEAFVLVVVFGVGEVLTTSSSRATMSLTTAVFFLVYGGGLAFCAWQLARRRSWTRAPIVLSQLIQLGVAWSFRGGSTEGVSVLLSVVAVVVVGALFHPASMRALAEPDG